MDLNSLHNLLIPDKKPARFLYGSARDIVILEKNKAKINRHEVIPGLDILNLSKSDISQLTEKMDPGEWGIVLNSASHIFNIFDFDKIPLNPKQIRDLVEWRLKKVFPESLIPYSHDFYQLNRRKILTVLFRNETRERIEAQFQDRGFEITYFGNSTIETINRFCRKLTHPDFVVEIDESLVMLLFLKRRIPVFMRKFMGIEESEMGAEISKSLAFVKKNHHLECSSYAIVSHEPERSFTQLESELEAQGMRKTAEPLAHTYWAPGG